jgi:hypothetical protein
MHDTIRLEKRGIPAVALVHDRFEEAARSQAKILGLPLAKIVAIPEPRHGDPSEDVSARIELLWNEILGALIKP